MLASNDNQPRLYETIDRAVMGQAITIRQAHRRFGKSHAQFAGHTGDGKHIMARKLISSMWKARWTKPLKVARADVLAVHAYIEAAR